MEQEHYPPLTEQELLYLRRRAEESGMGEAVIDMLDNLRKKRYPEEVERDESDQG